jgi:hypothetical protein
LADFIESKINYTTLVNQKNDKLNVTVAQSKYEIWKLKGQLQGPDAQAEASGGPEIGLAARVSGPPLPSAADIKVLLLNGFGSYNRARLALVESYRTYGGLYDYHTMDSCALLHFRLERVIRHLFPDEKALEALLKDRPIVQFWQENLAPREQDLWGKDLEQKEGYMSSERRQRVTQRWLDEGICWLGYRRVGA